MRGLCSRLQRIAEGLDIICVGVRPFADGHPVDGSDIFERRCTRNVRWSCKLGVFVGEPTAGFENAIVDMLARAGRACRGRSPALAVIKPFGPHAIRGAVAQRRLSCWRGLTV